MTDNYGGIETFIINIFRKLNGKGYKFEFIKEKTDIKIAYEDEILANGGVIHTVPVQDYNSASIIKKLIMRKKLSKSFFEKNSDYDAVHLNCVTANMSFWLKKANYFGIKKLIIHSHIDRNFHRSIIKKIVSELFASYNRIFINTNKKIVKLAASKKAGEYMFKNKHFKIISNGIDVEKYMYNHKNDVDIRKNLNISSEDKVILTVARLDHQKNYPRIISIFKKMADNHGNFKLVIVGDGPLRDQITKLVYKNSLEDKVIFLGIINNVNEVMSCADLILMPSLIEAFPFALLEGQAAGIPAVVSKDVIPFEENITGELEFVSLDLDDQRWAQICFDKVINFPTNHRVEMNKVIKNSNFNLNKSITEMKSIY